MLRSDRHANALAKQLLKPHIVQRTSLWGTSYQSELKPAIAYAIENGFVAPIVQSDVHLWHRLLKYLQRFRQNLGEWRRRIADVEVGLTRNRNRPRLFHAIVNSLQHRAR